MAKQIPSGMKTEKIVTITLTGVDLVAASFTDWYDLGDCDRMSFYVKLVSMTGGTDVDFHADESPDALAALTIGNTNGLTAGQNGIQRITGPISRYARASWTLNGGPSAATGDVTIIGYRR